MYYIIDVNISKKNYLEKIHDSFISKIKNEWEIYTEEIVIDNTTIKQEYILIPYNTKITKSTEFEKIIIPTLPSYNWNINKEIIKQELLFNSYFIS